MPSHPPYRAVYQSDRVTLIDRASQRLLSPSPQIAVQLSAAAVQTPQWADLALEKGLEREGKTREDPRNYLYPRIEMPGLG